MVLHDHLGFGLSDKPINNAYSLLDQAQIALDLWRHLRITSGHLLGHDYGTSIGCEIIAQSLKNIDLDLSLSSVTLGNGSMLIHRAQLLLSQKLLLNKYSGPVLAKLSNRTYFHYNFKKLWGDPSLYDRSKMDILWDLLIRANGRVVLPKLTGYIQERYKYYNRWVTNGLYKTQVPVHLFWGAKDPVAIIAMAYELHGKYTSF